MKNDCDEIDTPNDLCIYDLLCLLTNEQNGAAVVRHAYPALPWSRGMRDPTGFAKGFTTASGDNITLYELLDIFKIDRDSGDAELSIDTLYDILRVYIKTTYCKLRKQDDLYTDNDSMIFNTGLRDKFGNRIYAYYTNNSESRSSTTKWKYNGLGTREGFSKVCNKIRKKLKHHLNEASWSTELKFDDTIAISPDHVHCMIDNVLRLPSSLIDKAIGESISENESLAHTHKFMEAMKELEKDIKKEYSRGQNFELPKHIEELKKIVRENLKMSWQSFCGGYIFKRKIKNKFCCLLGEVRREYFKDEASKDAKIRGHKDKFLSEVSKLEESINKKCLKEDDSFHGPAFWLDFYIGRLKEIVARNLVTTNRVLTTIDKRAVEIKGFLRLELSGNPRGDFHSLRQYAIRRFFDNLDDVKEKLSADLDEAVEEAKLSKVARLIFYPRDYCFSLILPITLDGVEYALVLVEEKDGQGRRYYKGKTIYTQEMCYEYTILRKLFLKDS